MIFNGAFFFIFSMIGQDYLAAGLGLPAAAFIEVLPSDNALVKGRNSGLPGRYFYESRRRQAQARGQVILSDHRENKKKRAVEYHLFS